MLVDFGLSSTPTDDLRRAGTARVRGTGDRGRGETYRGVGRLLAGRNRGDAAHRRASVRKRVELGIHRPCTYSGAGAGGAPKPGHGSGAPRCVRRGVRREIAPLVGCRTSDGNGDTRGRRREHAGGAERRRLGCRDRARTWRALGLTGPPRGTDHGVHIGSGWARRCPRARRQPRGAGVRSDRGGRASERELPGGDGCGGRTAPGVADSRQALFDDATARTIDGGLPPQLAFAEVRDDGAPAWALVAPGLSIPPRAESCPYRGLMAFRSKDGDLFFGRDEVVASVRDRLLERGFMAVVGASEVEVVSRSCWGWRRRMAARAKGRSW